MEHCKDDDPWVRLANDIIIQAAEDYRTVLRRIKDNPKPRKELLDERKSLEKFFNSRWFHILSEADGDYIVKRIKKEEGFT